MAEAFERRLRKALAARPAERITVAGARAAAVLVPVADSREPQLILTLRTETLPSHRGQISFPGGSLDARDPSPDAAALREAHEEIGLDPSSVTIVGELDSIETFVSNYVITPVVGWIERVPELVPNPHEVARILRVPLAALTDVIRVDPGFVHAGRSYPTEAWIYEGSVIWGVTARILRSFLSTLADAGLAARPSHPRPFQGRRPEAPSGAGPGDRQASRGGTGSTR